MLFCMAKGDVTRKDPQRRFLVQHSVATLMRHCYDIVSNSYNIVPTSQRCVALKIVFFSLNGLSSHAISRQKHLELAVISHLLIELFYIGMPVMQTDGRTGVRSRDYQKKIIKFS